LNLDLNDNIYIGGRLDSDPLLIKNPMNKTVIIIIEPPSDEFFIPFGPHFLFFTILSMICIIIIMFVKQEIDLGY